MNFDATQWINLKELHRQTSEMNLNLGTSTNTQTYNYSEHDAWQNVALLLILCFFLLCGVFFTLKAEIRWRRRVNRDLVALKVSISSLRADSSV